MFKIFSTLKNIFFCDEFSILADYGDLSKYKYGELSIILIKWEKNIENSTFYRDVTWKNRTTSITIRYDNQTDKFVKIIKEEWINQDIFFKHKK